MARVKYTNDQMPLGKQSNCVRLELTTTNIQKQVQLHLSETFIQKLIVAYQREYTFFFKKEFKVKFL